MKLAVYIGKETHDSSRRVADLFSRLSDAGMQLKELSYGESPDSDTDMLLSVGGDGTFLSKVAKYRELDTEFVGVNLGSIGFLNEIVSDELEKDIKLFLNDRSIKQVDLMKKHNISRNTLKKYIEIVKG